MTTPPRVAPWRPITASLTVLALLTFVGYVFWEQDWKWGLPTPRPSSLRQLPMGAQPELPAAVTARWRRGSGRPLYLHFFNPDCPCSRFSQDHVRDLIRAHRGAVTIIAVIEPEGGTVPARSVARVERDLGVPALLDADGSLARTLGVYSSPQAVLVTSGGGLYFRGNYNLARYCTDARTAFAQLALESLRGGAAAFHAPRAATVAYGCPLPSSLVRPAQGAE